MEDQLISTSSELQALVDKLTDAPSIGFDTEFISEGRYTPQLCLVQIAADVSDGAVLALIDPLALDTLDPLWNLLCDDRREVIVHAYRSEMEFCHRATGRMPSKLFDVQLAAGFLGIDYPSGFRTLIDRLLKIDVPKAESRTVWNKRPLSSRQVEYALGDVRYLESMAGVLKERLKMRGRLGWYEEEITCHTARLQNDFETPRWRNTPKCSGMPPRELAIVRELWLWRDGLAKKWNVPSGRVLRDDLIVELAKRGTSNPKRISAVRGFQRGDLTRILPDICAAIQKALDLPDEELPPISKRISYPQYPVMTQFLYAALGAICKQENIALNLVAGPGDVRELIAAELGTLPPGTEPRLQHGWRSKLVGLRLRDILQGNTALRLDPRQPDNPLVFSEHL